MTKIIKAKIILLILCLIAFAFLFANDKIENRATTYTMYSSPITLADFVQKGV